MKIKEFDFRIYSHKTKKYYEPQIEFIISSKEHINENYVLNDICQKLDELELEPYTGLKDKKGIKIYENDIVLYKDMHTLQVIYKNGAFVLENRYIFYKLDTISECGYMNDIEITDNIHNIKENEIKRTMNTIDELKKEIQQSIKERIYNENEINAISNKLKEKAEKQEQFEKIIKKAEFNNELCKELYNEYKQILKEYIEMNTIFKKKHEHRVKDLILIKEVEEEQIELEEKELQEIKKIKDLRLWKRSDF